MASSQKTVDYITEQIAAAGLITSRKMFAEYALYCNGKVIGFVCDDSLFIKPTNEGKAFLPEAKYAPAYPGGKMYLLIPEEKWEDRDFMVKLTTLTADALPLPKPKKIKKLY